MLLLLLLSLFLVVVVLIVFVVSSDDIDVYWIQVSVRLLYAYRVIVVI